MEISNKSTVRVHISDHNPPGSKFLTPHGIVQTDADGYATVTPEQLAHLKTRGGLQVTTREMKRGDVSTRAISGKD